MTSSVPLSKPDAAQLRHGQHVTSWLDPTHFHLHHDSARSAGAAFGHA